MAQITIKKTAYAALGLPIQIVNKLREGVSSVAESADGARERLILQVQDVVDEWQQEGERITTSVVDKVRSRSDEAKEVASERIAIGEDVIRGVAAGVTQPAVPVEQINGIGPKYADELTSAGVVTTFALLERCDSPEAIDRLAAQTGISAALIESWLEDADLTRINGIGREHMTLLNTIGVGAISSFAEQAEQELWKKASALKRAEFGPIPSEATFASWIHTAKKLTP